MRRDLMMSVGGFEEQFTGSRQLFEDQAFLAKFYLVAPVYFSGDNWLDYRQHADSCVAKVSRSGQEEEVRRFFLQWLANYLGQQPRVGYQGAHSAPQDTMARSPSAYIPYMALGRSHRCSPSPAPHFARASGIHLMTELQPVSVLLIS